jgi:tripartite-type tricarboxylate transporter receptor subunit TctC
MQRALALVALALVTMLAAAQDYPSRTVRIIVPYPPGGVTDIAARLVAQKLNERWGQPVVAENRPGAGAMVGVEAAARSAPDGYTLLMVSGDFAAIHPFVYSKLPYRPEDLAPITMVSDTPMVIVASASSGINTVADLVAAAKARPGELGYGTPGQGTSNHLVGEWLASALGIKLLHVPYRGGAPAATAVAGGEVALGVLATSSAAPHVKSGKMRVLGLTNARRIGDTMSWPTLAESGVPALADFDTSIWVGLFAPAGVPRAIITKVNADTKRALQEPDVRERLAGLGAEPVATSPEELAARLKRDAAFYGRIAREAHIHLD